MGKNCTTGNKFCTTGNVFFITGKTFVLWGKYVVLQGNFRIMVKTFELWGRIPVLRGTTFVLWGTTFVLRARLLYYGEKHGWPARVGDVFGLSLDVFGVCLGCRFVFFFLFFCLEGHRLFVGVMFFGTGPGHRSLVTPSYIYMYRRIYIYMDMELQLWRHQKWQPWKCGKPGQ